MPIALKNHILDELADHSRRAILDCLRSGERTVTSLVELTGLKQPNVSNHLARLRERGIVAAQRVGRRQYYRLADPLTATLLQAVLSASEVDPAECPNSERILGWSDGYFRAISSSDEQSAVRIVSDCLASRVSMVELYQDVFQAALARIGDGFADGKVSVAQEHYATALTERLMARATQFYPSEPANGRSAVLGCVAGNWHAVGIRMIADLLIRLGWHVAYLGANVPTESFVRLVAEHRPDGVFVSCAEETSEKGIVDLSRRLQALKEKEEGHRFRLGIGGMWVNRHPEMVSESGADFTATDLRQLSRDVNALFPAHNRTSAP